MTRLSEQLEHEAEVARTNLAADLGELRQRVTPRQIVDQAVLCARDTWVSELGRNLLRDIRENPVPLLLIGAGIAWARIASNRRHRIVVKECPPEMTALGDAVAGDREAGRLGGRPGRAPVISRVDQGEDDLQVNFATTRTSTSGPVSLRFASMDAARRYHQDQKGLIGDEALAESLSSERHCAALSWEKTLARLTYPHDMPLKRISARRARFLFRARAGSRSGSTLFHVESYWPPARGVAATGPHAFPRSAGVPLPEGWDRRATHI